MKYLLTFRSTGKISMICLWLICVAEFAVVFDAFALESFYLVYGRPNADLPNRLPFPTRIYDYDENKNILNELWSTDRNARTTSIMELSDIGKLIVYEDNCRLHVFKYVNMPENTLINLESYGPLGDRIFYAEYRNGTDAIITTKLIEAKDMPTGHSFEYRCFSIDNGKEIGKSGKSDNDYNLRLSGIRSPYGGGVSNVLSLHYTTDGYLVPIEQDIDNEHIMISDLIIQMDSSLGWTLIANNDNYLAILSAPYRHGLSHRELLIYNKIEDKWHSMLIQGASTAPVIVNDWLVGVIADVDPETDFDTRKGFPPLLREDVVLINPLKNHQFTVHLGNNAEVLWIETDSVYYRLDDSLYKARIEKDDFVDRQLLLTDPRVRHFHWAFKGSMNEEKKTIQGR
jgi:hypothetical protein